MKKKNIILIISFLTILSLIACDYTYDYTYQVKNETDSEVKIDLKTFLIDTIYTIAINETNVLFITDHGLEGSDGPYFEDVSVDLDEFVVSKNDTLLSSKNYLDNSSWTFEKGLYTSTINNEEFK